MQLGLDPTCRPGAFYSQQVSRRVFAFLATEGKHKRKKVVIGEASLVEKGKRKKRKKGRKRKKSSAWWIFIWVKSLDSANPIRYLRSKR